MYAAINVYELLFSYKQTAQSDKYQNLKYLQHLYGSVQERIKLQLPYTLLFVHYYVYKYGFILY